MDKRQEEQIVSLLNGVLQTLNVMNNYTLNNDAIQHIVEMTILEIEKILKP